MRHASSRRRGFTLIELLVVVAIIALLISILLPSLREAREQAKIAKCLANLKQIALAGVQYKNTYNALPYALPTATPYTGPVTDPKTGQEYPFYGFYTEFVWGGGMPNKRAEDWDSADPSFGEFGGAQAVTMDTYMVPPRLRPMNPYFADSVSWDREPKPGPHGIWRLNVPLDIPGWFQCPSDRTAQVPNVGSNNQLKSSDSATPSWEWWGSSYPINWYWPYYYGGTGADFLDNIGVGRPGKSKVKEITVGKTGRFASQFIIFYENMANFALEASRPPGYMGDNPMRGPGKQLLGWHNKLNKHTVAFLDGHAAYKYMDTRFVFGDGWTIWPNKPWENTGSGPWKQFESYAPTEENARN